MPRQRTTKAIAQRIELDYLKKSHPFRSAMFWSVVLAPILAALWLAAVWSSQGDRVFQSGPVSEKHALFADDCLQCHVPWEGTPDTKCLRCHTVEIHQPVERFTPSCVGCHFEHKDRSLLSKTSDRHCAQCHKDLKTTGGASEFDDSIVSFDSGHPQFDVIAENRSDPGSLALNHAAHMKPGLEGKDGKVTLRCESCHVADSSGGYMLPVSYEKHCKDCHPLELGMILPGEVVPHEEIQVVDGFVRGRLARLVAEKPELLQQAAGDGDGNSRRRRRRRGQSEPETAVTTDAWLKQQISGVEAILWKKGCGTCHDLVGKPELPLISPTKVPDRWFGHAFFAHKSHRALTCTACHTEAGTSKKSSDVLLAPIQTCLTCHSKTGGAQSACSQCHTYHRRPDVIRLEGTMGINPLRVGKWDEFDQSAPAEAPVTGP